MHNLCISHGRKSGCSGRCGSSQRAKQRSQSHRHRCLRRTRWQPELAVPIHWRSESEKTQESRFRQSWITCVSCVNRLKSGSTRNFPPARSRQAVFHGVDARRGKVVLRMNVFGSSASGHFSRTELVQSFVRTDSKPASHDLRIKDVNKEGRTNLNNIESDKHGQFVGYRARP